MLFLSITGLKNDSKFTQNQINRALVTSGLDFLPFMLTCLLSQIDHQNVADSNQDHDTTTENGVQANLAFIFYVWIILLYE